MAFFIAIPTLDLIYVIYHLVQTISISVTITISIIVIFLISLIQLGCIDFASRGRGFLLLLPLIILMAVFLFFPSNFHRQLLVIRAL